MVYDAEAGTDERQANGDDRGRGRSVRRVALRAATSGNRDRVESIEIKPLAIDARGAELAGEIARLHERLRPSVTPRQPGRDLFSFVAPAPRPLPAPTPLGGAARRRRSFAPSRRRSSCPALPRTRHRTVWSAPPSSRDSGELFVAKEGDSVAERYRVVKISTDVVELADLTQGTTVRLALR